MRSQLKTKGNTPEIREPIPIAATDISGYVLMTLACICYLDNNILCDRLPRVTEDSPSGLFYQYVRMYILQISIGHDIARRLLSYHVLS